MKSSRKTFPHPETEWMEIAGRLCLIISTASCVMTLDLISEAAGQKSQMSPTNKQTSRFHVDAWTWMDIDRGLSV